MTLNGFLDYKQNTLALLGKIFGHDITPWGMALILSSLFLEGQRLGPGRQGVFLEWTRPVVNGIACLTSPETSLGADFAEQQRPYYV